MKKQGTSADCILQNPAKFHTIEPDPRRRKICRTEGLRNMKKKWMKGVAVAALAALSMGLMAGCGGGQDSEEQTYNVGLVQLVQHPALDLANQGMVDGLKDGGVTAEINQQNAQGEQSNLQDIAQQFIADDVDLILAIATPAAQVMASATEEIPIVGTAITSYADAGLVESDEAPNTNVTGTNDMAPIETQIDLLLQVVPDAKVIGTIYTSSEQNSEVQIAQLDAICAEKGLTVEKRTITSANDIQQAAQSLVGEVDAIYLPTDNKVASAMPQVVSVTDPAGLVTVCAEPGMVQSGGTLTYGIDYYKIGYNAGLMAAQILKGEATPQEMPIQGAKEEDLSLIINPDAVELIGIEMPADLMERATLTTEMESESE